MSRALERRLRETSGLRIAIADSIGQLDPAWKPAAR
jgi:hypothetical protein